MLCIMLYMFTMGLMICKLHRPALYEQFYLICEHVLHQSSQVNRSI